MILFVLLELHSWLQTTKHFSSVWFVSFSTSVHNFYYIRGVNGGWRLVLPLSRVTVTNYCRMDQAASVISNNSSSFPNYLPLRHYQLWCEESCFSNAPVSTLPKALHPWPHTDLYTGIFELKISKMCWTLLYNWKSADSTGKGRTSPCWEMLPRIWIASFVTGLPTNASSNSPGKTQTWGHFACFLRVGVQEIPIVKLGRILQARSTPSTSLSP